MKTIEGHVHGVNRDNPWDTSFYFVLTQADGDVLRLEYRAKSASEYEPLKNLLVGKDVSIEYRFGGPEVYVSDGGKITITDNLAKHS